MVYQKKYNQKEFTFFYNSKDKKHKKKFFSSFSYENLKLKEKYRRYDYVWWKKWNENVLCCCYIYL